MRTREISQKAKDSRVALVTGAGTGIGRAIVLRLARDGYNVIINDIDPANAEKTADDAHRLGVKTSVVIGNVGERAEVHRMVEDSLKEFGKIDALVNNAGIARLGRLINLPESDWRALFRVNVDGVFFCCQMVIPHMISRRQGAIGNISSWNGKVGMPCFGAYCATKFAVIGPTQTLAKETAPHGIRANAVCPGIVAGTAMRSQIEQLAKQFNLPSSKERAAGSLWGGYQRGYRSSGCFPPF